ncbi:MAG: hypothetical protein ABSB79_13775 [Syntrophales bacterium]
MRQSWPVYGWIGLVLVVVFWGLNWGLDGYRSHICFFPLWLGYCLTVDAATGMRKGTSLLSRSPTGFISLFVVSAPAWWLFETINLRTGNWEYLGSDHFGALGYFLFSTLDFSTVIPAVFGTAELAGTFGWIQRCRRGFAVASSPKTLKVFLVSGIIIFALTMAWPGYFYPFVWLSLYFCIEPVNIRLRTGSLINSVSRGDWRPVLALWTGVMICGFFWEMWNYYSYPKWIYHIPFVGYFRIFEMPLAGYLGYLPFSMELFALYYFIARLTGVKPHLELIPDSDET